MAWTVVGELREKEPEYTGEVEVGVEPSVV